MIVMWSVKTGIPFHVIEWSVEETIEKSGEQGKVFEKVKEYGGLRVRLVEYSPGYLADHWCRKGHVLHCIEGSIITEMEDGGKFLLKAGMSYVVSDNLSSHRSRTEEGARLLIVDGDFLR
jgi:hypothetical protein